MSQTSIDDRNRANAQHSTGPRTADGKQRSAANARKHGFTGRTLIVHEDEMDEHQQFLADWQNELNPSGPAEIELFAQIVLAAWNLRRVSRAEAELIGDSLLDPLSNLDDDAIRKKLALYSLYQSRSQREFHKAITELRKLQEERLFRAAQPAMPHAPALPRTHIVRQRIAQDKRTQHAEIKAGCEAALDRHLRLELEKTGTDPAAERG